jgi:uncharacterized protein
MIKPSKYNFQTRSEDGALLLYNARTGAFLAVRGEQALECETLLSGNTGKTSPAVAENLHKQGFLLDETINELEHVKKRFMDFTSNSKELRLTLLPSENCNFRCPYCFIYDRRGMSMKKEVYKAALAMVTGRLNSVQSLAINWFGGEPTLEKDNILAFMAEIRNLLRDRDDIKFSSGIYTNGYLLTGQAFLEYLRSGITFFQITLDGTEKTHDKVRSLRDGRGSFATIWKNLCEISKAAELGARFVFKVRVNFMKGQEEDIKRLTEDFKKVFGGDQRFSIYFRAVCSMETSRNDISPIANDIYGMEEGLAKQVAYYLDAANSLGSLDTKSRITAPIPDPIGGWCAAQKNNSWILGADGLVFKCDTLIGDASTAYGRLLENGAIESFNKTFAWDKDIYEDSNSRCISCKFLPVCQGGCPRDREARLAIGKCYYTEDTIAKAMVETHHFYINRRASSKSTRPQPVASREAAI